MSEFKLKDRDLAGFDLCGWVQINGTIRLNDRFIDKWPKEITLCGATYTLENVIDGAVDEETGAKFQSAQYV